MENETNQVIELLTENRVALNGLEKTIERLPRSRYTSLALTSLEKGRMYLGEIALDFGKDYPYEKTKQATSPEMIQKAVDLFEDKIGEIDNEIVTINKLRDELNNTTEEVLELVFNPTTGIITLIPELTKHKFIRDCNISEAYRSIKEARMWLGKRLGEIRDNAVNNGNGSK